MNEDTFIGARSARLDNPQAGGVQAAVLGVVVPVPEPWAQLLIQWRAKVGDPQASRVPPHVTLLPPTEVAAPDRQQITAHLAEVARTHPPFDLALSGTGTFRPVSEVVYVTVTRGTADCELVSGDVRSGPLNRSLSFPYHPHVTVAHDVPTDMLDLVHGALADLHGEFRVEHFTEFEQTLSGDWVVVREYPLTGPAR